MDLKYIVGDLKSKINAAYYKLSRFGKLYSIAGGG